MKNAVFVIAIGKYSRIFISLIINIILSRLLTPEDYGVVAVVTVFTTFFASLSDMGLSAAVIQIKELSKKDIDSIFSFSVYYALLLAMIFIFLSGFIADFYGSLIYKKVCILLSIALLFEALNTVPNGIMNRKKKFKEISMRIVLTYIFSAFIAIILAFLGWKYYALVMQSIITAIITFLWNYKTTRPKFHFSFSLKSIDKIKKYSSFQFAFNILVYFSRNLDNLLTGKFMGSTELGFYNKAYTLMLYPVNNITNVIAPVLHPVLSDYQNKKNTLYISFVNLTRILFLIGTIISGICIIASSELIILAFGNQWFQSIDCFKVLSIAIVFQMINGTTGAIYQSLGNTKQLFLNGAVNSVITIVAIFIGIFIGKDIYLLALAVALAYVVQCLISFSLLIHFGFQYKIKKFFFSLRKEIGFLIIIAISIVCWRWTIPNMWISLIIKSSYILMISLAYLLISKEYIFVLKMIKKK